MSEITPEIRRLQAHAFGIARDVAAAFETKHNDGSSSAATFRALADHLLTEPEVVRAVTAWAKAIEREVERGGGATRSEAQDGERTHAKRLLDRHCSLELRCTLSAHQQEWWALNREREASEVEILQVLATGLQARRVESDRKPAAGMNLSQEKRRSTGLGPVVIAETAKWAGATWDTDGRWGFSMEAWQKFTTSLSADQPMEILTSPGVSAPESVAHPSHQTVREWMPVSEALRLSDLWTAGDLDNCGQWRAAIKVLADEVRALAASPQPEPSAQGEPVALTEPACHGNGGCCPDDKCEKWKPRASAPSTPPHAVVEAVPLNFDQLQKVMSKHFGGRELTDDEADSAEAFARAIERAHGIAPKAAQEKT
jgi:hypothetical protein